MTQSIVARDSCLITQHCLANWAYEIQILIFNIFLKTYIYHPQKNYWFATPSFISECALAIPFCVLILKMIAWKQNSYKHSRRKLGDFRFLS